MAYALLLRLLWPIAGRRAPGRGGLLRPRDLLDRAIDIGGLGGFDRAIDNDVFVRGYADPYCGGLVFCVKLLVKFIWLGA